MLKAKSNKNNNDDNSNKSEKRNKVERCVSRNCWWANKSGYIVYICYWYAFTFVVFAAAYYRNCACFLSLSLSPTLVNINQLSNCECIQIIQSNDDASWSRKMELIWRQLASSATSRWPKYELCTTVVQKGLWSYTRLICTLCLFRSKKQLSLLLIWCSIVVQQRASDTSERGSSSRLLCWRRLWIQILLEPSFS